MVANPACKSCGGVESHYSSCDTFHRSFDVDAHVEWNDALGNYRSGKIFCFPGAGMARLTTDDTDDVIDKPCNELRPFKGIPHDPINSPAHYTAGGIETIDYIEAKQLSYHLGNAVKYISRAGRKGDVVEDLKKARWYIDRAIEKAQP